MISRCGRADCAIANQNDALSSGALSCGTAALDSVHRLTTRRLDAVCAADANGVADGSRSLELALRELHPGNDPVLRAALRHHVLRTITCVRQRSLHEFLR